MLLLKNPSLRKYRRTHLKADATGKKSLIEETTKNKLISNSTQERPAAKGGDLHVSVDKSDQGALLV